MKVLEFNDLIKESVNVVKIEAVERRWKLGNINRYPNGRCENIISYTLEGGKKIIGGKDNEAYSLDAPAIILISEGTAYQSETLPPSDASPKARPDTDGAEAGHTICIRFVLYDDSGEKIMLREPFRIWKSDANGKLENLFRALLTVYLSADAPPITVKARIYDLLAELISKHPEEQASPKYSRILPAIKYIEKHLNENTSISELAKHCYLSESYFRSCFCECVGCSPNRYRTQLRIDKANKLLESSLWSTELIAEELGFCDTAHFCHVYKRITGKTPRSVLPE